MAATNLRALYLLDILRQETDGAHRLTVPQLVDALAKRGVAAERKSLYRDIRGLIAYGADIRKSAGGYYLEGRAFSPGEVRILAEALRASTFLTQRRTEALAARLGALLSRHQAQSALEGGLGAAKAPDDQALRAMEALAAAIGGRYQVTFAYGNPANATGRLRGSPYGLLLSDGRLYLACGLEGGESLSLLPLSRITAVRRDATPWRPFSQFVPDKDQFSPGAYAARLARFLDGEARPLLLLCKEEALPEVLERLEPAEPPQRQGSGRFLLAAQACESPALLAWLLSFGDGVEVLEPLRLREALRQSLALAWSLYKEPME